MTRCLLALMLLTLAWAVGCDSKPASPPPTQPAAAAEPATQQADATRRRLLLSPLPVSIDAPASWRVEPTGQFDFLHGPLPHGECVVLLARGETHFGKSRGAATHPIDWIALHRAAARREQQADPQRIRIDERPIGPATVFEKQNMESGPITGPSTSPTTSRSLVRWTFTVFVPRGDDIRTYELSFLGLSAEQFQQDKDLLTSIMSTLRYEPPTEVP